MNIQSLNNRIDRLQEEIQQRQAPPVTIRTVWGDEPLPEPESGVIVIKTVWGIPRLEDDDEARQEQP